MSCFVLSEYVLLALYIYSTEMMQVCASCHEEKTLDRFHRSKGAKNGRHAYCKQCRSKLRKGKRYDRPSSGTKQCPRCLCEKSVDAYYSDKSAMSGLQTYCKSCQQQMAIQWGSSFNGFLVKLFGDLKNNARKRQISVHITKMDIAKLYKAQNGRCALTNLTMTHVCEPCGNNRVNPKHASNISVDRIDSQKPYTTDNIQLVCNRINTIKWDLSQTEFIRLCKLVAVKFTCASD